LVMSENTYYQNIYTVEVNRGVTDVNNPTTETLRVYPNPTQGVVHVENADGQEIVLYDALGKWVTQTKENYIDLSAYPKGVYMLRVGGNTVKILKQ